MATYTKRGDKWQARFTYKTSNNQYKQKAKWFNSKAKAQKWAREQELYFKDGVDKSSFTIIAYFDNWYETYKRPSITERTDLSYKHSRAIIKQYFGNKKLNDLTHEKVQKFVNAYGQGTTPFTEPHAKNTVSKAYVHLKACLKQAVRDDIFRHNPADDIQVIGMIKPKSEQLKYLNEIDQEKLTKYLVEHLGGRNVVNYLILTALDTGMRLGELLGLPWENVSKGSIFVNQSFDYQTKRGLTTTKGDNPRTITISDNLYKYLMDLKNRSESDLAFASYLGKPLSPSFVDRSFKEIQEKIGIKQPINFHGLRHSHASLLLYKGVNIAAISKRLGHKNTQMTLNTYSHILDEMRTEQDNLVDQIVKKRYEN